jgi:hypothetical protein
MGDLIDPGATNSLKIRIFDNMKDSFDEMVTGFISSCYDGSINMFEN